jgi:hypothetical protein
MMKEALPRVSLADHPQGKDDCGEGICMGSIKLSWWYLAVDYS